MFAFTWLRKSILCTPAAALLLAMPASAAASTHVGVVFAPSSPCKAGFTFMQIGSSQASYAASAAGVITSWSFQASASPPQLKLKVGRHTSANKYTIIGESGLQLPAPNTLNTFATRIPVRAGDLIGEYLATGGSCGYASLLGRPHDDANVIGYVLGDLGTGTSATFSPVSNLLADLAARVEPDADHDGYGDETQDSCFTDPSTHGACTPPKVSGLPQNGRKLTATLNGSPTNPTLQWLRCNRAANGCAPIAGATAGSYTLTSSDIGHTVRVRKSASNSTGIQQARSTPTTTVRPAPGACTNRQAHPASIGNDTLGGTTGGDRISGLAGNDILSGGAGGDCLNGGPGNDRLFGNSGKDTLSGGPGNDVLNGGSGNDRIKTGGGRNKVIAGGGNDNVNSVNGKRDAVDCGSGHDTVRADKADELIRCEVKHVV